MSNTLFNDCVICIQVVWFALNLYSYCFYLISYHMLLLLLLNLMTLWSLLFSLRLSSSFIHYVVFFSFTLYCPTVLMFLTFQVTVRWFSPLLLGLMIKSPWSRVSIIFSAWLKLILWKLGWAITRFIYAGETEKTQGTDKQYKNSDVEVNTVGLKCIMRKSRTAHRSISYSDSNKFY